MDWASLRALTFDVFGTVVDWRSSIMHASCTKAHGSPLAKGITHVDWASFAAAWRAGYGPAMDRVRQGDLPWTHIDDLHRLILDQLLVEFRIGGLSAAEKEHFNRAWHRLSPWPDAVTGLHRLKERYIIATLSNGNVALLTNMAKRAGLPWDCILSAELFRRYKPDAAVYTGAAVLLGLPPEQVMMAAAHKGDLRAAHAVGMRTAFVPRPQEFGPGHQVDTNPEPWIDVQANDFVDLARRLGA